MYLVELPKDDTGFIDFNRFTHRPAFFSRQADALNEKRFISYNYFPRSYSKTIHPNVVAFDKTLPRDDKLNTVNLTPSNFDGN